MRFGYNQESKQETEMSEGVKSDRFAIMREGKLLMEGEREKVLSICCSVRFMRFGYNQQSKQEIELSEGV